MCVRACARVCARACMCVRVRERQRVRVLPLEWVPDTGTLRHVPAYRAEATRIGALGITAEYRQPYFVSMALR